jgi:hypothetical protein
MCHKIRRDGKSKKFCNFFGNKAFVVSLEMQKLEDKPIQARSTCEIPYNSLLKDFFFGPEQ